MKTATQQLHAIGGKPMPACADLPEFTCWICGAPWSRGLARSEWNGATFTGQNRVRCIESNHVCEPCVWAMAGKPPNTLRLTSHLLDARSWLRPNKGQKPMQREWLRGPKSGAWFAAIADSGKKHVVPWTPVNPAGLTAGTGLVLFEERQTRLGDWQLVDGLSALLTAGASKEQIESAEYAPYAWALCGDEIRVFEGRWSGERASDWWALALWLAQRDEVVVQARQEREKEEKRARQTKPRTTAKPDRGGGAGDAGRVPRHRGQRAQALGSTPGPATGERQDVRKRRGVVDPDEPVAAPVGSQCDLFGSAP